MSIPMDNPLLFGGVATEDARDVKVARLEKRVNVLTYLLGAFLSVNCLLG